MNTKGTTSSVLYVIEQHDQLLELWHSVDARGLRVIHFDFHCDMRGLLVDRDRQLAFFPQGLPRVDEGNFLAHAIAEKRLERIRWIHDIPGGRKYDVGTVMYTTDLSVQPIRWLLNRQHKPGFPFGYQEMEFSRWEGALDEEFMDIDWDFFAARDYPPDTLGARVEAFLGKNFERLPTQISVCYSPRYSHSSRPQFEEFVDRLAGMFHSEIVYLPLPQATGPAKLSDHPAIKRFFYRIRYLFKHMHYETSLWLRKRDIY